MKPTFRLLVLGALLLACGPSTNVHDVHGVVREVQVETRQIVVAHGEIEGVMSAMTMNFDVADESLLEQLEPGDVIDFKLEVGPRSYRILEAEVVGSEDDPESTSGLRDVLPEREPAPAFSLRDQEGRELSLSGLAGRVVVLDFVYTRCSGPCPILTGKLVDVQRSLEEPVRDATWFVSITLDPEHDTPERLREYARARGADLARWSFLTGPTPSVEGVIRAYGVGRVAGEDGQLDHMVVTYVIDREGRIARRFVGLDPGVDQIRSAVERLAG
jgi:protein SCO1/2